MPTYEYACRDCGRHLEVVQSFTDKPLTKCPSCKGALKKVFSPVGIVLKGSGFYKTDSRSKTASKAKETAPTKSGADSAKKSDAGGAGGGSTSSTSPTSAPTPSSEKSA